ncbi:hypothetical protein DID88_004900 [Monilinia fructigena]|uniref:Ketoreductase (KR) domain-containing protein n=1 Tax=Monilinia fructigena TaxID=38457 RepID=A0A395IR40_9HELO|nr:hypothetical protein DID88_004900 [Monilinia fructigena]
MFATVLAVGLGLVIGRGVWGRWFGRNRFVVGGKTILLTGASEGMGKAVAIELAKKGASVIIVARNVGKLERALGEVEAAALSLSNQFFHYISADVSIPTEAARILQEATAFNSGTPPDIVWCIAGVALYSQHRKKERHLIFTSSVLAFYSVVGYTPYSPAKAAIKSLSDTLYQEVLAYPNPPQIHTVFPGTIASPGLEIENQGKPEITHQLESTDPIQTPEEVARNAIRAWKEESILLP